MDSSTSTASHALPQAETRERFAFLAAMGERFVDSTDLDEGLRQALDGLTRCLTAQGAILLLFDDYGAGLTCRLSLGPWDLGGAGIPLNNGVVGRCLRDNAVIASTYVNGEAPFPDVPGISSGDPIHSMLCAPMGIGVVPLGAVCVFNGRDDGGYDASDEAFASAAATAMAMAIYNSRLSATVVDQDQTQRDLQLAADIQRNLLPRSDPKTSPVNGINRPARLVSGDFFDYITLADGTIPFTLGDVSGKGMNAALLMAKTASLFRCLAKSEDDPAALLRTINREICETATRGMFVTIVTGVYNPATGLLRFANAGHEPPLLRMPDRNYRMFPAEAPPIGILPDLEIDTVEIDLQGGEFYVFSDGLTEFGYRDEEMLGVTGLIQMVEVAAEEPLSIRLAKVLAELDKGGWEARDDLTVLTIDGAWVPGNG